MNNEERIAKAIVDINASLMQGISIENLVDIAKVEFLNAFNQKDATKFDVLFWQLTAMKQHDFILMLFRGTGGFNDISGG